MTTIYTILAAAWVLYVVVAVGWLLSRVAQAFYHARTSSGSRCHRRTTIPTSIETGIRAYKPLLGTTVPPHPRPVA